MRKIAEQKEKKKIGACDAERQALQSKSRFPQDDWEFWEPKLDISLVGLAIVLK